MQTKPVRFIAARENRWFTALFAASCRLIFRCRFHRVWIDQHYRPGPESRTIYFLNHNSWWDGIIPLMLNHYRFGQQARAMMEDRQMVRYPFFSRIGAFSVSLDQPRSTLRSLRYAVQSMERDRACLFIYPEGKIVPVTGKRPTFQPGIAWLWKQLPKVDFVPIAISIHTIRSARPELHIRVGEKMVRESDDKTNGDVSGTEIFEWALHRELEALTATAGFTDEPYQRLL